MVTQRQNFAIDHPKIIMGGQIDRPLLSAPIKQFLYRDFLKIVYDTYISCFPFIIFFVPRVYQLSLWLYPNISVKILIFPTCASCPHAYPLPENMINERLR